MKHIRPLPAVLSVTTIVVAIFMLGPTRFADANAGGWVICGTRAQATCDVTAEAGASAASTPQPSASPVRDGWSQGCHDPLGHSVACYDATYGWLRSDGCYYKPRAVAPADPADFGGAGEGTGGWYDFTCPAASGTGGGTVWLAGPPPGNTATVDPAVLARQATSHLDLPRPTIGMSPTGLQVVRVPTWLWITTAAWAARTATAAVPGLTVTATATPSRAVWTTGDGGTVTCTGPGTPWTTGSAPSAASPTCGHTYLTDSTSAAGGTFTVTATISWTVTWTDGATGGTEPMMTTTATAVVRVLQVIGVDSA